MLAPLLAIVVLQTAQAESSLAAGDVQNALQLATKIVQRNPDDAAAHFLLGRVHYARPIIGRYPALEEFKKAARRDPTNPAPLYWQMKIGFYLRSDEGDVIAREALLALFALTPDYEEAWERFHDVYRNPKTWRRAERALARHGENPVALERRAEMLIALDEGARAESLLAILMSRRPATTATSLLRAEAAFQAGRVEAGYAWHDSALARADADSSGALWDEAWLIASPEEKTEHAATPPGERRRFFERFWQRRDPNLVTPENERIREHYARTAEARRMYRLLHPQRSLYHSARARALAGYERRLVDQRLVQDDPYSIPGGSSDSLAVAHRVAGLRTNGLQNSASEQALRAGLTAPGLVFLRYGKPDKQASCETDLLRPSASGACNSFLLSEAWLYWTAGGPLTIRFWGNEYFAPISQKQIESAYTLLETDRTTVPAPLVAHAWSALFQSAELGLTDIYYKAKGDAIAVDLWNLAGGLDPLRARGTDLVALTVPPGRYDVALDVDSAGVLGRVRRQVGVPSFSAVELGLSSLVLAPSAILLDREPALQGMPADLVYRAGVPLASYVEIYGLTADQNGRSHYRLRYSFTPMRSLVARLFSAARPVVFEFDRETDSTTSFERLIIEPDRLPAGRYRVTLAVTDLSRNVKSESVALEIEIR